MEAVIYDEILDFKPCRQQNKFADIWSLCWLMIKTIINTTTWILN